MNKLMSLAMAAATVATVAAPAFAADDAMDKVTSVALFPTRVGGVVAGTVVGTPIAVARESFKSYCSMTSKGTEMIHAKDCGPAAAVVSLVTIPGGLVVGGVKGSYYGVKNGVVDGFTTPFHPNSFSMTKFEE